MQEDQFCYGPKYVCDKQRLLQWEARIHYKRNFLFMQDVAITKFQVLAHEKCEKEWSDKKQRTIRPPRVWSKTKCSTYIKLLTRLIPIPQWLGAFINLCQIKTETRTILLITDRKIAIHS